MSSELLLFNTNSTIVQLYHGKNKLLLNEMMMMMSTLYKTDIVSWIFVVLGHWNNSPGIDMSLETDTFSWFQVNQS